jgi:hypothetical protein
MIPEGGKTLGEARDDCLSDAGRLAEREAQDWQHNGKRPAWTAARLSMIRAGLSPVLVRHAVITGRLRRTLAVLRVSRRARKLEEIEQMIRTRQATGAVAHG